MFKTKSFLLIGSLLGSLLITGCGGDSSGSNDNPPPEGIEVSGTVTAPGGTVAMLGQQNPILIAITNFIFSPAYADITGLDPVEGATVELIRIDDLGIQIGDVLASTTTSITGDYTLTVPAGTDLGGDLIVRVTGIGGIEMRAQVVDQAININPVSEFVLRKFISEGTGLAGLTTNSVLKLVGQVEEFDLTAGADLDTLLEALEEETGAFVEDQIATIESTPGDGTTVAGNYRGVEFDLGLHDDDQQYGVGTLSVGGGIFDFLLSDEGNGAVGLTFDYEEDYYSNQFFFDNGNSLTLSYDVSIDTGSDELEPAQIDNAGVFSSETEFEEDIDGDFGWRFPPSIIKLQKALNTNVFIGTNSEASVRYRTVDTNDDQIKDAIDPNDREGDEVFKKFIMIAEQPDTMTTADLSGDFGRVYFETVLGAGGYYNARVEHNIISFDGFGSLDIEEVFIADLTRTAIDFSYTESNDPAEAGLAYGISENGSIFSVEDEDQNSLFNDTFDFLVIHTSDAIDNAEPTDNLVNVVQTGTTIAVKLPDAQLDISNKVYRVFFLGVSLTQNSTALATARFNTMLTMNSDGLSASITSQLLEIEKASPIAEVESFNDEDPVTLDATVNLATNGETTIVIDDPEGSFTLNGYLSHDGSLGVFHSRYADTDADPDELGVVMLVEIAN